MMQSIVLFCHIGVALLIIGFVLLQRGKGADAGTGFGAGASGTVFGARGSSSFFSRATAVLATIFFITSLSLAYLATQTTAPDSLLDEISDTEVISVPTAVPSINAGGDVDALPALPSGLDSANPGGEATEETAE